MVNFINGNHFTCLVKNPVYVSKEGERTKIDSWISHDGVDVSDGEGYFLRKETSTKSLIEAQIHNCQADNPHILVYTNLGPQIDLNDYPTPKSDTAQL